MTYSSCQNKGPVILRVLKNYIRDIATISTIKFSDVQGCCNKKINNRTVLKN